MPRRTPLARIAHRKTTPGSLPGQIIAEPGSARPTLHGFFFGPDGCEEKETLDPAELKPLLGKYPVSWVNVNGLGDADTLRAVGALFDLHPLALEDAANPHQRPKVELYEKQDFIVVRMANRVDEVDLEQLSLFLGSNYVVTIQEAAGDCFGPIRDRIRKGVGRIRSSGPDLLTYALIDAVIDFYFPVLEQYGERLDTLEETIENHSAPNPLSPIHALRRDLLAFRRSLWPLRDALNSILRDPSPRIQPATLPYFRDCYDHVVQLIDLLETYRELTADLSDLSLSIMNKRLNEVMKVLTIISTLFMPMTFVASIYGMNFVHMPELKWVEGYPMALGLMALMAIGMILYFRRKGWFDS